MFSLIKGFWTTCTSKPNYKILIIGTENSGKTTLLNQLKAMSGQKYHAFDRITPTVGLNIGKIEQVGFTVLLWDLGGKDILRPIWRKYYPECFGIVFVIDGSNEEKLEESLSALGDVMHNKDVEGVPILILVNKKDKPNFFGKEKVQESNHEIVSSKNRSIFIIEVSALNKVNIDEAFTWLYEAIGDFYAKSLATRA